MTWLRDPIILRRWHVVAAGAVVGVACAAAIVVGAQALRHAATVARHRREDLRAELQREAISRREVERIARRTARLERPSATDLLNAIHRAAQLCERRPRACARAAAGFGAAALQAPDVSRVSPRPATRPGALEPTHHPSRPTSPTTRRPPPAQHDASPGPARPNPPPPGRPPAPVAVHPPPPVPPVTVCTGLIDVGDCG